MNARAAAVHYQMVTIHPFEDGNGRTARLMSDYVLDLGGYGFSQIGSLEEYFAYDIDEYYRSLQMGLPSLYYDGRNNPPHPEIWLSYFLRMMELHAQKVVELADKSEKGRTRASLTFLSTRERDFLEHLKQKGIRAFSPIEMARTFKVTNRTVINWCANLAKNGFWNHAQQAAASDPTPSEITFLSKERANKKLWKVRWKYVLTRCGDNGVAAKRSGNEHEGEIS